MRGPLSVCLVRLLGLLGLKVQRSGSWSRLFGQLDLGARISAVLGDFGAFRALLASGSAAFLTRLPPDIRLETSGLLRDGALGGECAVSCTRFPCSGYFGSIWAASSRLRGAVLSVLSVLGPMGARVGLVAVWWGWRC
jgi:hypothetical protein